MAISQFTDDIPDEFFTKETFIKPYLRPPCNICGSMDHGMLRKIGVMGDDLGEEYACPVAYYEDWKAMLKGGTDERNRICPRKLADQCEYDTGKIDDALKTFAEIGEGRTWSRRSIDTLRQEVIDISIEVVRNLPFKRDMSIGKVGGQGESGEDDDDGMDDEEGR